MFLRGKNYPCPDLQPSCTNYQSISGAPCFMVRLDCKTRWTPLLLRIGNFKHANINWHTSHLDFLQEINGLCNLYVICK